MNKFIVSEEQIIEAVRDGLMFSIRDSAVLSILMKDIKDELRELLHYNCKTVLDESEQNVVTEINIDYGSGEKGEETCVDEDVRWNLDIRWNPHDLWFCDECKKKIENHIRAMVDAAEQERKARKRLEVIDVCEFSKIKEGKIDIVRVSKEYPVGEVIDICYNGLAYKDSVKCKVMGCYKSVWAGYIIEFSTQ